MAIPGTSNDRKDGDYTFKCKHTAPWNGTIRLAEFWTIPLCPECRQIRIDEIPKAFDMYEFITVLSHKLAIASMGKAHIPVLKYCNAVYPEFHNGGVRVTGTGYAFMPAVGQWEVLKDGVQMDIVDEHEAMEFMEQLVLFDDNIAQARLDVLNGDIKGGTGYEQRTSRRETWKGSRPAFYRG